MRAMQFYSLSSESEEKQMGDESAAGRGTVVGLCFPDCPVDMMPCIWSQKVVGENTHSQSLSSNNCH